MIKQYSVIADPETGDWLTTPRFVGYVDEKEWIKKADTLQTHYDCFERWIDADACVSETCAIEERWEN